MDRFYAERIVDAAMAYRAARHWFLPGTRDKAIEAAMRTQSRGECIEAIAAALEAGETDFPSNDPHDECRSDRWFYYHPAMVL